MAYQFPKLSTPPKRHEIDALQDSLAIYVENGDQRQLDEMRVALQAKSTELRKSDFHQQAQAFEDLVRLAILSQ